MKTGPGNKGKTLMFGAVAKKSVPQVGNKGKQMPIHGHGNTKGGGDNIRKTANTMGIAKGK